MPADVPAIGRPAFDRAALALIALQSAALLLMAWGGFYYQDDFLFMSMARDAPASVGHLTDGAFGHFFPGFRAAFLFLDRTGGLGHHWLAVLGVAVCHGLTLVAMWRLLVLLFGRRPAVLGLMLLFGCTSLWMSPYLWFVGALQVMPATLCTVLALHQHVRFLETARVRNAVGVGAALAVALLFYEKPVQLVVMLPLLTVLCFSARDSLGAWVGVLRRAWPVWAAVGVVLLVYVAAYVAGDLYEESTRPDVGTFVETFSTAWFEGFWPSLLGGPLTFAWNGSLGQPAPATWLVLADQLVLVAAVAVSVRMAPRMAWRGWVLLLASFAMNVAVIALTRAGIFGSGVGRELKYLVDILPFAVVGIGIALLGLRVGPRAAGTEGAGRRAESPVPASARRPLAVGAALACCALFTVSVVKFDDRWSGGISVGFAERFLADLEQRSIARPDTILIDGDLPAEILAPAFQPYARASVLLRLFDEPLRFSGIAARTFAVQPSGRIAPVSLAPVSALRLDEVAVDGTSVGRRSGRRPFCRPADSIGHGISFGLAGPVPGGRPYARVEVSTTTGAYVSFSQQTGVGRGATTAVERVENLPVPIGRHAVYVPLEAAGATTLELVLGPAGQLCVTGGFVGVPAPTDPPR